MKPEVGLSVYYTDNMGNQIESKICGVLDLEREVVYLNVPKFFGVRVLGSTAPVLHDEDRNAGTWNWGLGLMGALAERTRVLADVPVPRTDKFARRILSRERERCLEIVAYFEKQCVEVDDSISGDMCRLISDRIRSGK